MDITELTRDLFEIEAIRTGDCAVGPLIEADALPAFWKRVQGQPQLRLPGQAAAPMLNVIQHVLPSLHLSFLVSGDSGVLLPQGTASGPVVRGA